MANTWRCVDWDDCALCGGSVEVLSDWRYRDCADAEMAYEDDEARCMECGATGRVSIDDYACVLWNEESV